MSELWKCQNRTIGHDWEPYIPIQGEWNPKLRMRLHAHFMCLRCDTRQHLQIDSLGNIACRTYDYSEQYKRAVRLSTEKLRLKLVRNARAVVKKKPVRLRVVS